MDNQQVLDKIANTLERIAAELEAKNGEIPAPNYKEDIKNFTDFNWESIWAKVLIQIFNSRN
jgi:hypothetical protein